MRRVPNKSTLRFHALGALALVLAACGGEETVDESEADLEGEGGSASVYESLEERDCPEDSIVTFEDFGGPFMMTWCNGCHSSGLPEGERQGGTMGVDFDTIELIRAQADRIWIRSGDQNVTMPPVGGPDAFDRELLGEWLACGAPTNADLDLLEEE